MFLFYGINPYDEAVGTPNKDIWKYIFEVKKKDVYAGINEAKAHNFFGFLIYLMILWFLLRSICHSVTEPVRQLAFTAKEYGKGNFGEQLPSIQGKNELADLSAAFHSMRENLISLIDNEKKEAAQAQQRKTELDLAQKIQLNALPTDFPENSAFDVSAFIQAAKEVGGDLYDFFFIDKTHFAFLVADVTGKGMPAALFMMTAQAQIRSSLQADLPLKDALEKINAALCKTSQDTVFITAFIAVLDTENGIVEYVSAGHNPPVLKRKESVTYLEGENSIPLAAMEDAPYFVNRVFEDVHAFAGKAEQSDDITMLCLTYRGKTNA